MDLFIIICKGLFFYFTILLAGTVFEEFSNILFLWAFSIVGSLIVGDTLAHEYRSRSDDGNFV